MSKPINTLDDLLDCLKTFREIYGLPGDLLLLAKDGILQLTPDPTEPEYTFTLYIPIGDKGETYEASCICTCMAHSNHGSSRSCTEDNAGR